MDLCFRNVRYSGDPVWVGHARSGYLRLRRLVLARSPLAVFCTCPERAMSSWRVEGRGRDMRRPLSVLALCLTLATSAPPPRASADSLRHVEVSRMSMACLYTIDAYAAGDEQALRKTLEDAL